MPGSAFNPAGFGRRAAAITIGLVVAAGAAGTGWWQTHLSTSPSCQITAPAPSATLVSFSTLTALCGSTASFVGFEIDGNNVAAASDFPFTVSWDSAGVSNGTHMLAVQGCDDSNNCVTSAGISVTTSNVLTPVNTGLPSISGVGTVGSVLTATNGSWTNSPTGYTYQWKDDNGSIAAATSQTYTIGGGEAGLHVYVTVTATNASGSTAASAIQIGPIITGGVTPNLWVDNTSGGSCTRSGGGQAYSHGVSCSSFQAAYTAAQTGDLIGVACGGASSCTYGDQTISTNNAGLTNYVTFEPEAGVTPQLGCYTTLANDGSIYQHGNATINVADSSCWTGASTPYSVNMNVGETTPSSCTTIASATQFTGCVGGTGTIVTQVGQTTAINEFTYPLTVYRPGRINVQGSNWIKFDGFNAIELDAGGAANHLTFTNGRILIWGIGGQSNDINITFTHIGPLQNGRANAGPHGNSTNITFDHDVTDSWNAAGDVTAGTFSNYHGESFYIGYGDGLTISNSSFTNYAEFAIFISPGQEAHPGTQVWMFDHVHIFNNFFGAANTKFSADAAIQNYNGSNIGSSFSPNLGIHNWTIEYNTFDYPGTTAWTNYPGGESNVIVRGNYGLKGWSSSCGAANTWDDNKWTTTGCTGDRSAGTLDVVSTNTLNPDLHLTAGASAIGQGDPLSFPATDYDGGTRTNPPDAGADQFGAP